MKENQKVLFSRKTAVIAILALVAGALVVGLARNASHPITAPFPQKSAVQVGLKPAKVDEDIRYTSFWPDGRTPMNLRVERKNGETVYSTFTPQGFKHEVKEFYPLPKKDSVKTAVNDDGSAAFPSTLPYEFSTAGRQLKSYIVFSEDGKEVVSTERYRPDGTREVVGKRLPDGGFQNLVFHKDGLTLSISQLFASNGDVLTEQQFAEGGSRLIASSQREADGFLHSKSFRDDGSLKSIGILTPYEQTIDFYREDGVTRYMTVDNTAYSITVVYFRPDGEALSKRVFSSDGDMTVTELVPGTGHYGEMGKVEKAYTEGNVWNWHYVAADTAAKTPEHYVLTKLAVHGADGKFLRQFVFNATTGKLERIWMYDNGVNTHDRMYNPDGTLKEVGWLGTNDESKAYNAIHAKDADRQPGAKIDSGDLELIKRYGKDTQFEDPRPLLSKVQAPPQQYYGED